MANYNQVFFIEKYFVTESNWGLGQDETLILKVLT